jgi:hypothetical protein
MATTLKTVSDVVFKFTKIPQNVWISSHKEAVQSGKQPEMDKIKNEKFKAMYGEPKEHDREACLAYQLNYEKCSFLGYKEFKK